MTKPALRRSLSLPVVALYGLGNILGAGIYVLVGKVAGEAGAGTVLAFLLAMVIAAFTAFSYMELSGRFPVSASASVYLYQAFRKRWLSVAVGLAMVLGGITSAAALAQGFAGYFVSFIDVPKLLVALGLLIALGLLAIRGIGESAKAAAIFTLIEVGGLLLVVWFGRSLVSDFSLSQSFQIDPVLGLSGLVAGTFLAFYAFIGFEDMVNVAEESQNPRRTMPIAILISLIVSTVLYLLVVTVASLAVPANELAASDAPLALVVDRSGSDGSFLLALIGMAATLNGVIVQIIMGSRTLYGLAREGWIPRRFASVGARRHTPLFATACVVLAMVTGVVLLPLVSLAQLTSLIVLTIFTLVNAALIVVKRRQPVHAGYVTVPLAVPYLGVLLCAGTILYQLVQWL